MKCILITLLILYSIFDATPLFSQARGRIYKNGYVVTNDFDTLRGKINVGTKIRLKSRRSKNIQKFKHKELLAYKFGKYSYENIGGEYYRIAVNGPVRYYVKESFVFTGGYNVKATYFCVKRKTEKQVTVLCVRKVKHGTIQVNTGNVWTDIAMSLGLEMAVNAAIDLNETNETALLSQLRDNAAKYFADCAYISEGIAEGKYFSIGSLHDMVERYNKSILMGVCDKPF